MNGLYVPLVNVELGTSVLAVELKVKRTLLTEVPPPASDITIDFFPSGETRSMSTSAGKSWRNPESTTVTLLTKPSTRLTLIREGNGFAGVPLRLMLSLMAIAAELANTKFGTTVKSKDLETFWEPPAVGS